jgi:tetratricopeptide (TPR) repeat protein
LAERHIKKAIALRPDKPHYHYVLGFVYSMLKKWRKAIREFKVAVNKEPDNHEYLRGLGWALHRSGNEAKGFDCLHRALDLDPTNVGILNDLAAAYLSGLQLDEARKYAEKAMRIDPDNKLARGILDNVDHFQADFGRRGEA